MISEKKFIELLNLYLDHEASPEQLRALETEVRRDPARYRLYREYCVLHRGCIELGTAFTPAEEAVPELQRPAAREFARTLRRPSLGWGTWASGLGLAAACGALAFYVFTGSEQLGGPSRPARELESPAPALVAAPYFSTQNNGAAMPLLSQDSEASAVLPNHTLPPATTRRDGPARLAMPATFSMAAAPVPSAAPVPLARPARVKRLHPVYSPGFPRSYEERPERSSAFFSFSPVQALEPARDSEWGAPNQSQRTNRASSLLLPANLAPPTWHVPSAPTAPPRKASEAVPTLAEQADEYVP